ncbi:alpha-1,4-glucan--maltose-1-phosphate maltosyltransferase [Nakamurella lactea]|uniref:alpha-1,4-glucan--maltose-1-phosphate maltosyltransferase n=1 Tax=Nakamurella lactea TaxID=459515 RepID=UPI000423DB3C|nr:alpha-1,4-glucan--maltose-1-phosphate maltosyltransferase [Nakamurella lactea]
MVGRIGLNDITPLVACGRYPAKAVVGRPLEVGATVFREGHDAVAANVVFRPVPAKGSKARAVVGPLNRMTPGTPGTDRWSATVTPDSQGMWSLTVEAWSDPLATWRHTVEVKAAAGQLGDELANDLETGARLLDKIARRPRNPNAGRLRAAAAALRDPDRGVPERLAPALDAELWKALVADPIRELITRSAAVQVWVDRPLAEFGSWYELFPRSIGGEIDPAGRPLRHGTLRDAIGALPRVAAMGFDIVYLPPVHPIGEVNRKGRNNSVTCEPDDVGSPWAIGSAAGGHDAIHPELGTIDDFDAFAAAAGEHGLAVALDIALQCAPDHPWVSAHPEWFTTRPDGTIAYAENPPKKYQDIYPLNFDNDPAGLYQAVLEIFQYWIAHGVTVFRVDNPHTKPLNFWEWLIAKVRADTPDAIFLAEAFTKPAMMHELARVGFSQSYTYFTWRTGKAELTEYGVELVEGSDYMRPNFFVNTPDILHASLQFGGEPMFAIRAVLAATMVPSWGVYSGYELFEHVAVREGSEEYLNSEKYQLRPRDFAGALADGRSLEPLISSLNRIRRAHPALQQMKGLWFHQISNDNLLCYSRRDQATGDTVLVVVALQPWDSHWGQTDLYLPALGMEWGEQFEATDLLDGQEYIWGQFNTVGLHPVSKAAHVFAVRRR